MPLETRASTETSTHSSLLTPHSSTFTRPGVTTGTYYYSAMEISISTSGIYTFSSSSSLDTYGCFYNDCFNPLYPSSNLIAEDDDGSDDSQYLISVNLQSDRTYTLVTTAHGALMTGSFKVIAVGPVSTSLVLIGAKSTVYSGSLISSKFSPTFTRPGTNSGKYYYASIQVAISTSGLYEFGSSSSIDTYGCFYNGRFISFTPTLNLIAQNDDDLGDNQYLITVNLQSNRTYTLVTTTHRELATGSFSITSVGPDTVKFTSLATTVGTVKTLMQKSE